MHVIRVQTLIRSYINVYQNLFLCIILCHAPYATQNSLGIVHNYMRNTLVITLHLRRYYNILIDNNLQNTVFEFCFTFKLKI